MYEGLITPFPMVPFEDMKKKEVEQYFNWFMETKEERLRYLQQYIIENGGNVVLDKSPESLSDLWEWFRTKIEWEEKTQEEIDMELQERPEWMKPHVLEHREKLSVQTIVMALDISVYFGETIIYHNPTIYWGYLMKPKKLDGVNRPQLRGFQGDISVFPYGLVEVCIRRSSRSWNRDELLETYRIWCKNV